jgi:superfamily II DNA or RNA helicase
MKTVTISRLAFDHQQLISLPRYLDYRRSFLRHLLHEPLSDHVLGHLFGIPSFVRFVWQEMNGPYWLDVWEPLQTSPERVGLVVESRLLQAIVAKAPRQALSRHPDYRVRQEIAAVLRDQASLLVHEAVLESPPGYLAEALDPEASAASLRKLAASGDNEILYALLASPNPDVMVRFPQVGLPTNRWVLIPPDQGSLPCPVPGHSAKRNRGRKKEPASRLRPVVQLKSMRDFMERILDNETGFRGTIFTLPESGKVPSGLYPHQVASLEAIERHMPAYNGVVHLPTGGGKTHIAMRFAASYLAGRPHRKLLWASYPKQLIRQSMARIVELAPWFPPGTRIAWYDSWMLHEPHLLDQVDVLFVMRDQLGELMARATLARPLDCPLRRALVEPLGAGGYELTLVYDECHQIAARKLRGKWQRLIRSMLSAFETARTRFHVVGLSATPVPQGKAGRRFVGRTIFPSRPPVAPGETPQWGLLTYHQVSNKELVDAGVLCPVNLYYQDLPGKPFEIPRAIVGQVTEEDPVEPPNRVRPSHAQIQQFSSQFNRQVMSADLVLEFLAKRIGDSLDQLGKTLVFVPTIDAANQLGRLLAEHPQVTAEKVLVVHSRLDEEELGDGSESQANAPTIIEDFKSRGHDSCVLVNVGMLTQGFDDPAIATIVLARLTFSTNLFWQMIGRGTRGPRTGGTRACHVIDPIRLGDMYDFLEGYRPRVTVDGYGKWDAHFNGGARLARAAVLPPQLPRVSVPPLLSECKGELSVDLPHELVELLTDFLAGRRLAADSLIRLATAVEAVQSGPNWNCCEIETLSESQLLRWMHDAVVQVERRTGATLYWLTVPPLRPDETGLNGLDQFFRRLWQIESDRLFTEHDHETRRQDREDA